MRKPGLLVLWACSTIVVGAIVACHRDASPSSQTASAGAASTSTAGARIDKPFTLQVSGADCYSGTGKNAGDVAFGFPNRAPNAALRFTLGPLRDGLSPGQENNKPYSGPGDYTNVGIALRSEGQTSFVVVGTVTVNPDEQSGTFRLPDGSASGTWDCGHKLAR